MAREPSIGSRAPADGAGGPLAEIEAVAREAGAASVAREAAALAERVADGRFYVAVIGQFKRGKSTLVNALVEDGLLPTGVVPVTSVVTVVRYGTAPAARIRGPDGGWRDIDVAEVGAYVSEQANPDNAKAVTGVEVFAPSALLGSGMCLVDTPGLGSVFTAGTEATRAFVPHIDAALVVLGADPPITDDELRLVDEVAGDVDDLVVVLNKADRISDTERQEAKRFTERVLSERIGREVRPILEVSAAERLAGDAGAREWRLLRERLVELAETAGASLVAQAERRGLALLCGSLRRVVDERREALSRPLAESAQRVERLRRCAEEAERAMGELRYLLDAEQDRMRKQFAERKQAYLRRSADAARAELSSRLREVDRRGPALRHRGVLLAQEMSKQWLELWRAEEEPAAEALYRQATARFVDLANQFLVRLASSGDADLAALPSRIGPELGFRVKSGLYYKALWSYIGASPFRWIADQLRSRARITDGTVLPYLDELLFTNATRIENDFNERVLESRRRLEFELRARLADVYAAAEDALARARRTRAAGAEAVEQALEHLKALERRVDELTPSTKEGERAS